LDQQELATLVVFPDLAQEAGHLEREGELTVHVLVEAVVAAGRVAQEERRWPALTLGSAAHEIISERRRIWLGPERDRPAIRDRGQASIHLRPERGHERRERCGEVVVLVLTEAMAGHVDARSEALLGGVTR